MDIKQQALKMHQEKQGKLMVKTKVQVRNEHDLTLAYSPGVAEPCLKIYEDQARVFDYTNKGNFVAVVSNGTAVLGLGNIGPAAALPVMEGKAVLFKEFGGVDAFPICIAEEDPDQLIATVQKIATVFGGINLEDIKAPECFYIEKRLKEELDIPVFHDDQHGTAIITLAGLINALTIVDKKMAEIKVVVNGAGAAGVSITDLLIAEGVKEIIVLDSQGALYSGRAGLNQSKERLANITNPDKVQGQLGDIIKGADVFIGVSIADVLTKSMVRTMKRDAIIFAMANPDPEIRPADALAAGARIVGTGRSDYPNQVNNVLAFPGIFRGALDVRAKDINEEMKKAAAYALAGLISKEDLSPEYVIPKPFEQRVGPAVAAAVAQAAVETGVARIKIGYEEELRQAAAIMQKSSS